MSSAWNSDDDLSCSSDSSFDEDDVNHRVRPYWPSYLTLFKVHGIRLDTLRDVKEYYHKRGPDHLPADLLRLLLPDHSHPCINDDDALCPDYGLPDNLFRGTRVSDGQKVVIKATHIHSRECDVIRMLSLPPLRNDPMNHTIPILDFIEVPKDKIIFIVMEQWSSQLLPDNTLCCLKLFLAAMRQCIEHTAFLHKNQIAHLDISVRNLLTDYKGHYAYIDYELSRSFVGIDQPLLYHYRGTEVPPECERGEYCDPYKVDIWALGILIYRTCKDMTSQKFRELCDLCCMKHLNCVHLRHQF